MAKVTKFPEQLLVRLAAGTTARIDRFAGNYGRPGFIRDAVERRLRQLDDTALQENVNQQRIAGQGLTGPVLYDEDGAAHPPLALCATLGCQYADPAAIDFLIWHRGVVLVDGKRVRMRAEVVSPATLGAALSHLSRSTAGPIDIEVHVGGWLVERHPDITSAISRLYEAAAAIGHPMKERFLYASRPMVNLPGNADKILRLWHETGGELTEAVITTLRETGLWDALIVVETDGDETRFVHVGALNAAFSLDWRRQACGLPTTQTPDQEYGGWVTRIYHHVIGQDEPHFRQNIARIAYPGRDHALWPYITLDLPWRDGNGRRCLTALGMLDPRVPLRLY